MSYRTASCRHLCPWWRSCPACAVEATPTVSFAPSQHFGPSPFVSLCANQPEFNSWLERRVADLPSWAQNSFSPEVFTLETPYWVKNLDLEGAAKRPWWGSIKLVCLKCGGEPDGEGPYCAPCRRRLEFRLIHGGG